MTNTDDELYETIPDDHPIWAEREALMFPAVDNVTVNDGAPYSAQWGYRYSQWPRTAGFFADQITESASAMRPAPRLCKAVCSTHQRGCDLRLAGAHGDEHTDDSHGNTVHLCRAGGWGHQFLEETRP